MGSSIILNIDELLEPIAGENAAGVNLRESAAIDSIYRQLGDARATARKVERKRAELDPDYLSITPDWGMVLAQAPLILQQQSKDLEVAAWLTEALLREHGLGGLRDGLRLIRQMLELYWDRFYSKEDEEGLITRMRPLVDLSGEEVDGTLIQPLATFKVTNGKDGSEYSEADCREAIRMETATAEIKEKRQATGAATLATIQASALQTPATFFRDLLDDVNTCLEECTAIEAVLQQRYDEAGVRPAPSLRNLREQLCRIIDAVKAIGGERAAAGLQQAETPQVPAGLEAVATVGSAMPSQGQSPAAAVVIPGAIGSRDAAFEQLLRVAEYFRRAEPQSIVGFALEQVVRWGRMPLPELLAEFIPDGDPRAKFQWLGIKPAPPENSETQT